MASFPYQEICQVKFSLISSLFYIYICVSQTSIRMSKQHVIKRYFNKRGTTNYCNFIVNKKFIVECHEHIIDITR